MPKYKLLINTGGGDIDMMIEEWIGENTSVTELKSMQDVRIEPTIIRLHYQMATVKFDSYVEIIHSVLIEYK